MKEIISNKLPDMSILYNNEGIFEFYLSFRDCEDGTISKTQKNNESLEDFFKRIINDKYD